MKTKCGFCGHEFDPAEAETACAGCPLASGCHLIRCPQCGYEMPPEAKLVGWLRGLRKAAAIKESHNQFDKEFSR
ncbi:MAG: hypothetical protein V3S14_09995 [Anaerolineae bacterium]